MRPVYADSGKDNGQYWYAHRGEIIAACPTNEARNAAARLLAGLAEPIVLLSKVSDEPIPFFG
jgi:hypothetical protein